MALRLRPSLEGGKKWLQQPQPAPRPAALAEGTRHAKKLAGKCIPRKILEPDAHFKYLPMRREEVEGR